jgi:hypothetical protein
MGKILCIVIIGGIDGMNQFEAVIDLARKFKLIFI